MESISSPRNILNIQDDKKRNFSKVVDVERVLADFRRLSEEIGANLRSSWEKSNGVKFVGSVTETNQEAQYVTGSTYKGTWDATGMAGVGKYTMPHGVIYEGELRDGIFHGRGTLEWPQKQRIDGVWLRGKLQEKRYTFSDGLAFQEKDWDYCQFPDRRFYQCIREGLNPAGLSLKTAKQPTPLIHPSSYDAGDGIFHPQAFSISSYNEPHEVIRIATKEEGKWITENCRKGTNSPVGYNPLLNENWSTHPPNLPYNLPLSDDSPQTWWQRLTTFERDVEVEEDNEESIPGGEDVSHELCYCYEFGSSEEEYFHSESTEDHCAYMKVKICETDIEKEEYAAFREIICNDLDKYDDLDWSETICIPPQSPKTSSVELAKYPSELSWREAYSEEDFSFETEIIESEKQVIPDEAAIRDSSLAENKVHMKDDGRIEKKEIKKTEEAKKEDGEIMMKSEKEEILQDLSKQEIENDLEEVVRIRNEEEDVDEEEGGEEDKSKDDLLEEQLKADVSEEQILVDNEDKEDNEDNEGKEDKSETDFLEAFKESEDIDVTEDGDTGEDHIKQKDKKEGSKIDQLKTIEENEDIHQINKAKDKLKASPGLLKSLPKGQKVLQTRSSPQLQQKKHPCEKEGDFGFSSTFTGPRSKLEFVRKPCDPNICSNAPPAACAHFPENDLAAPCKPKRVIEMVHLRIANKRWHE